MVMGAMGWLIQWNRPDDTDLAHRFRRVEQVVSVAVIVAGPALAVGILTT
jgi:hypothetical protein